MPPLLELVEAWKQHDQAQLRAVLADDVVMEDHRRALHDRVEGADAFLHNVGSLWELAPDIQIDLRSLSVLAYEPHGSVTFGRDLGTFPGGGAFERPRLVMCTVRRGRITRLEFFEVDGRDVALARLTALRPDLSRVPPNAAARLRDRLNDAFTAKDWDAMRALASRDLTFEDRRKWSMLSGGVDLWIKSVELIQTASGVAFDDELIGALGERIELRRRVVTGAGPDGNVFESEFIVLTEIDADGRITASINFDLEDRRAAFAEAHVRFFVGEAAASDGQAPIVALGDAAARHDWEAMRRCLADDIVVRDTSTLGLGPVSGEQFIDALRAQADLAPDVGGEVARILAWNDHGRVDVVRVFGTIPTSGGPFEKIYVRVLLTDGGRIRQFECYDVAQADRAVARFDNLCGPHSAPKLV
jgi:ketosteroid isomerase-like protein